ncbi:hypothetical protein JCM15754A_25580 [Prevotella aurantiaca JCM 15754]
MNFTSSLKEGRENSIESESLFRVSVDSLVIERYKYLPNKVLKLLLDSISLDMTKGF